MPKNLPDHWSLTTSNCLGCNWSCPSWVQVVGIQDPTWYVIGGGSWQQITPWGVYPCHWGVVNGGCVVMGIPHPSHSFTEPHSTVYKHAQATRKKTFDGWNSGGRKINVCKMKGVDCSSHRMRAFVWDLKVPKGSLSSQWSSSEGRNQRKGVWTPTSSLWKVEPRILAINSKPLLMTIIEMKWNSTN